MDLKHVIRDIPDFPQPGILFRDITPVMEDPAALRAALDGMAQLLDGTEFDRYVGIESRGFLFGAPLAVEQKRPLVLLRKAGKLPGDTEAVSYDLEYGQATLEIHRGSVAVGQRVVIVDDLLATGGTAAASGELIRRMGAEVAAYLFLVELAVLEGRARLTDAPVFSLVNYE